MSPAGLSGGDKMNLVDRLGIVRFVLDAVGLCAAPLRPLFHVDGMNGMLSEEHARFTLSEGGSGRMLGEEKRGDGGGGGAKGNIVGRRI